MKFCLWIVLLLQSYWACAQYCCMIEKIQTYKNGVNIMTSPQLRHDRIDTATFNIDVYMGLYDALNFVGQRKVFDCYYLDNFYSGEPHICIKDKDFDLYKHVNQKADKIKLKGKEREEFIQRSLYYYLTDSSQQAAQYMEPQDTEAGYVQYLYFCEFGELFALKWHSDYKRKEVICSTERMKEIVQEHTEMYRSAVTEEENGEDCIEYEQWFYCDTVALQNLLFTESAIDVVVKQDDVLIKWVEMEAWNGIFERTYKIERHQPHSIVLLCEKELVEFQYSFVF